jgi:hypothetical protein
MVRSLLAAIVASVLLVGTARGQVVRGVVVEEASAIPIEGAMVILLDYAGEPLERVLTDADGEFIIDADRPGPHFIRVDRIGYESITTERFAVPVGGTYRRVEVPIRAVQLEGIDVSGSRRCEVRPEEGRATAQVWEEARKALEAAAWTVSSGAYRYTLLHYTRELDASGRRVLEEDRRFDRSWGQAPYVSAPAQELSDLGYVRRNPDGSNTYFAPDAEVFLSDPFLDTHCMRLDRVEDGLIGLEFEPVRGRRLPDIRGTLWIEAASAELKRLELRYTNLPWELANADASGSVIFGRLPNGSWIVREWYIRMPRMASAGLHRRPIQTGYFQDGGVVWRVIDHDGTTLLEAETVTLAGTVVDSTGARPVPGAVVLTDDGFSRDTTGEAGSFLLPGLAPGLQRLTLHHPSLDTLGLGPVSVPVEGEPGEITPVTVVLPGVASRLSEACGEVRGDDRTPVILLGRVLTPGESVEGARVRLLWHTGTRRGFDIPTVAAPPRPDTPEARVPVWAPVTDRDRWLETTLDGRGVFLVCGGPAGTQVRIEAALPDGPEAVRNLTIPSHVRVMTVTLNLQGG